MKDDLISREAAIDALEKHEKSKGHNYSLFVGVVSECEEIIRNLPSATADGRWIPVSEKPPEFPCIAYLAAGQIPRIKMPTGIYTYETDEHGVFYADSEIVGMWADVSRYEEKKYSLEALYQSRIIAWMPLPGPYEEG